MKFVGKVSAQSRNHSSILIGGIRVPKGESHNNSLVPERIFRTLPPEIVYHLRWLAQKYNLGQDTFLCGHPGPLRRQLVMTFANLCGLEVEYISCSRDTTESDLKQRREIIGKSVFFHDQPPIRAVLRGRLLVLDGIEYAERNVLPTLNNLLENREISLEDGRFITSPSTLELINKSRSSSSASTEKNLLPSHPNFRVIALGRSVPPYTGQPMDPPLRSRLQSHFVDELQSETLLDLFAEDIMKVRDADNVQKVLSFYESLRTIRNNLLFSPTESSATSSSSSSSSSLLLPIFSVDSFAHCIRLMKDHPDMPPCVAVERCVPASTWMSSGLQSRTKTAVEEAFKVLRNKDYQKLFYSKQVVGSNVSTRKLLPNQVIALSQMAMDFNAGKHVCILGPKGCGKSYLVHELATSVKVRTLVFPLYQELSARDLLQRRITLTESDGNSRSSWVDSPLVTAARNGWLCVLDGIDRADVHGILTLRSLLQDGRVSLPNGETILAEKGFRVIAVGLSSTSGGAGWARWISSDLGFTYHLLQEEKTSQLLKLAESVFVHPDPSSVRDVIENAVFALENAGNEFKLSLRQILRLHKEVLTDSEDSSSNRKVEGSVLKILEKMLLVKFMPKNSSELFYRTLMDAREKEKSFKMRNVRSWFDSSVGETGGNPIRITVTDDILRIGDVTVKRRQPDRIEMVPQPLYYENESQNIVLQELLRSYKNGERSFLLIGNQGVGKNKLIDRFLHLLNAEREYIQLHRDSTMQTLTLLPTVEDGKIIYKDSPAIRAAAKGSVLVVDEADKAQVEVACLLKGLAEDGEVMLQDGRRLLSHSRYKNEGGDVNNPNLKEVILIHPQFILVVLANRPGFPFLGNDFFKSCGDIFHIQVVDNPGIQSEIALLSAYYDSYHKGDHTSAFSESDKDVLIGKIARAFSALRQAHQAGELTYPFSAREAVSVVKHLAAYSTHPTSEDSDNASGGSRRSMDDLLAGAVENILAFDRLNPTVREKVAIIFKENGIPVAGGVAALLPMSVAAFGRWTVETVGGESIGEAGQANPKFSPTAPKHGKVDEKNEPHVGGNTWAGGSGGTDTAGLGGVGGPYRLDGNHPVHQVPQEIKDKWSAASREQAKALAKSALQKTLADISMGKNEWEFYSHTRHMLRSEITELRLLISETIRRKSERVWLRNQHHGELDDTKLIDGLAGESLIFKRRGPAYSDQQPKLGNSLNKEDGQVIGKLFQFVVDVSGSMYRFNGMDRRLERMLESVLLLMEALPSPSVPEDEELFTHSGIRYAISGHSGEEMDITFVPFTHHAHTSKKQPHVLSNEKERLKVLQSMVAHSQYTESGDNTLSAMSHAVDSILKECSEVDDTEIERFVFVVSDANFQRYGISVEEIRSVMLRDSRVQVHLILIASLSDEAQRIAAYLPAGRTHLCFESTNLPLVFRNILTDATTDKALK